MQDLVKWSMKDENRAIQDALTQVGAWSIEDELIFFLNYLCLLESFSSDKCTTTLKTKKYQSL